MKMHQIEHCARNLNTSGLVLERQKDYAAAEDRYEQALQALESAGVPSNGLLPQVLFNLARVCRLQGKSAEAVLLEDRAERLESRRHNQPLGGSGGFWALLGH